MSETKTSSGSASGSSGSSTPKTEAKADTSSKSETKATPATETKTEAKTPSEKTDSSVKKSNTIQNGKGSAPRNMGPQFKQNFTKIKWGDAKRERQEGRKEVKVYG